MSPKKPKISPIQYAQAHPFKLGGQCSICIHPWRKWIDEAIASGLSNLHIVRWARDEGDEKVTIDKLKNHKSKQHTR